MKLLEQSQLLRRAKDKVFKSILEEFNITRNELNIIMFLNEKGNDNDTASDIVNEFLFTKSHVSVSVDSLIKKGYIIKESDNDNKKINHLKVTQKACCIIQESEKKQREFIQLLFKGVNQDDKKIVEKVFNQMHININNILNSE